MQESKSKKFWGRGGACFWNPLEAALSSLQLQKRKRKKERKEKKREKWNKIEAAGKTQC